MPLSELLPKAVKTKLNSSSELPPLEPDSELAELLWENGQVVVQGQSHRGFRFFSSSSSSSKDIGPGGAAQYEEDLSPWPNLPVDDYGLEFLSDFAVPDGGADPARPARSEPGESSLVDPAGCPSQEEDHRRLPKRRRRGNSDGEDEKPSPSARRGRAAEVHNLSERRRRDRINEKLRALQELIPNCSKVDKASVLDDAIEYLKSLQMRVRVMSMGGGIYIPPMMIHPGMPTSHMGMGMGMRFGMAMVDPTSSPHVPWSYSPTAVPFVGGRHMYASPPISTPLPAAAPPARAETGGTHP